MILLKQTEWRQTELAGVRSEKKYRWHWVSFREIASRGTTLPTNRRKPLVPSFPCFSFVCAFRFFFFFFIASPFFELDARTRSLVSIFASQCAAAATFFLFFLKSIHGQLFVKHGRLWRSSSTKYHSIIRTTCSFIELIAFFTSVCLVDAIKSSVMTIPWLLRCVCLNFYDNHVFYKTRFNSYVCPFLLFLPIPYFHQFRFYEYSTNICLWNNARSTSTRTYSFPLFFVSFVWNSHF